jgi:Flp pilus assembly pilin Flp
MLKYFVAVQSYAMNAYDDLRTREDGQTMAEYGVVLAVIAVGIIVALTALSGGITNALNKVTAVVNK